MKSLIVFCLFLSPRVLSSEPSDETTDFPRKEDPLSRVGTGRIVYSWHGDQSKKPVDCGSFEKFTSRLTLTPVTGRPVLFGDGNHARIEYYLTVRNTTTKILDVVTSEMKFLFSEDSSHTYFWGFKLLSSSSSDALGTGYTGTGFYQSSGKLSLVTNNKEITLGWQSDGDGLRLNSKYLRIYGEMTPAPIDSSVGYCLTKWSEQ